MTASEIATARPISEVFVALGGDPPKRGHARAFWRNGDNQQAVSLDDSKNVWYDHRDSIGGGALRLVQHVLGSDRPAALRWLADFTGLPLGERPLTSPEPTQNSTRPTIIDTYDYADGEGRLLYQVVREEPKKFKQRYPNGRGGWIWKKHPNQVLYHLPEVLKNSTIFVVEGEKDVETLRDHGFIATTNAGGARAAWLPQFTEALRGCECIIIPDNDKPGWERAAIVSKALLGVAGSIRVWDLPKGTKDISDWFASGHSECELIAIVEGTDAV